MLRYTLYLGLNDKDTKTQLIDSIEAYKIVENCTGDIFGGCTIFNAKGIYKHDNGEIVFENTLRIEILDFEGNKLNDLKKTVETFKTVFNQESIAVQIETVQSELW